MVLRALMTSSVLLLLAACGSHSSSSKAASEISDADKQKMFTPPTAPLTPTTPESAATPYSVYRLVSATFAADVKALTLSASVKVESTAGLESVDLVGALRSDGSASLVDLHPLADGKNRLVSEALCTDLGKCDEIILNVYYNVAGKTFKKQFSSDSLKAKASTAPRAKTPDEARDGEDQLHPSEKNLPDDTDESDEKLGDYVGAPRNEVLIGKLWPRSATPELPPVLQRAEDPSDADGLADAGGPGGAGAGGSGAAGAGTAGAVAAGAATAGASGAAGAAGASCKAGETKCAQPSALVRAREEAKACTVEAVAKLGKNPSRVARLRAAAKCRAKATADLARNSRLGRAISHMTQHPSAPPAAPAPVVRPAAVSKPAESPSTLERIGRWLRQYAPSWMLAPPVKQPPQPAPVHREPPAQKPKVNAGKTTNSVAGDLPGSAAANSRAATAAEGTAAASATRAVTPPKDKSAAATTHGKSDQPTTSNAHRDQTPPALRDAKHDAGRGATAATNETQAGASTPASASAPANAAAPTSAAAPAVQALALPFPPAKPDAQADPLDQKITLLEAKLAPLIDVRDGGQARGFYGDSGSEDVPSSIVNAQELPANIPGLVLMFTSNKSAHWGSGMLVSFLENAATYLFKQLGLKLYVGDMSLKNGGDFGARSEHNTHQNGLDADLGYIGVAHPLQASILTANGDVEPNFDYEKTWNFLRLAAHQEIIEDAQKETAVSRIYMSPAVKVGFCKWASDNDILKDDFDAELMRLIRPTRGHDKHFHLSLKCSPHYPLCRNFAGPPPAGTGCPKP